MPTLTARSSFGPAVPFDVEWHLYAMSRQVLCSLVDSDGRSTLLTYFSSELECVPAVEEEGPLRTSGTLHPELAVWVPTSGRRWVVPVRPQAPTHVFDRLFGAPGPKTKC